MRRSRRQVRPPSVDLMVVLVETQREPRAVAAGCLLHAP